MKYILEIIFWINIYKVGVRILLNKVSVITVANKKTENPTNLIDSFLKQTLVEKELLIMTDSTLKSQDNIKVPK